VDINGHTYKMYNHLSRFFSLPLLGKRLAKQEQNRFFHEVSAK